MKRTIIMSIAVCLLAACGGKKNNQNPEEMNTLTNKEKAVALLKAIETGENEPIGYVNAETTSSTTSPSPTASMVSAPPSPPWQSRASRWSTSPSTRFSAAATSCWLSAKALLQASPLPTTTSSAWRTARLPSTGM